MIDPRMKPFSVTLEIEGFSIENVIKRLEDLIEDERTISFEIKQKEEE